MPVVLLRCTRRGTLDERVIDVCRREGRALVTLESAIQRVLDRLPQEPAVGTLWIVEERRIRIRG